LPGAIWQGRPPDRHSAIDEHLHERDEAHLEVLCLVQVVEVSAGSAECATVCRSRERIWFLLHRGQFHLGFTTKASALPSTRFGCPRNSQPARAQVIAAVRPLACDELGIHSPRAHRLCRAYGQPTTKPPTTQTCMTSDYRPRQPQLPTAAPLPLRTTNRE
jgi:hypothetical protein